MEEELVLVFLLEVSWLVLQQHDPWLSLQFVSFKRKHNRVSRIRVRLDSAFGRFSTCTVTSSTLPPLPLAAGFGGLAGGFLDCGGGAGLSLGDGCLVSRGETLPFCFL
jgi:hypothetical protein